MPSRLAGRTFVGLLTTAVVAALASQGAAQGLLNAEANVLVQSSSTFEDPACPSADVGEPIATRFVDGELIRLPGARGPGEAGYEPIDDAWQGQDTHPFDGTTFENELSLLSWNFLMATVVQNAATNLVELGGQASVWVPAPATFEDCVADEGITFCWSWPIAIDERGNISGSGGIEITGMEDGSVVGGSFHGAIRGRLRRGMNAATTRLVLKMKLFGSVHVDGFALPARFKARLRGDIHPDGSVCSPTNPEACLLGDLKFVMVARPPGFPPIREVLKMPFAQTIPRDEGAWTLALAVLAEDTKRLGGTATAELGEPAAPSVIPFDVDGRYKERRDESKLRLHPVEPDARGQWVKLKRVHSTCGDIDAAMVKFKLFGQKGKVELPADACCSLP